MIAEIELRRRIIAEKAQWLKQSRESGTDFVRGVLYGLEIAQRFGTQIHAEEMKRRQLMAASFNPHTARRFWITLHTVLHLIENGNRSKAVQTIRHVIEKYQTAGRLDGHASSMIPAGER